ncbi:MAG: flagellar protein FliS [Candidatus Marinimicrobia bacterium]|nr:flagellar protein FliS [Candidatus Neomarinimicrobiota bacterium]
MRGGFDMARQENPNPYLKHKVMTASPEELVSYVYDIAIKACKVKNKIKALEAMQVLINSLNFDEKEMAMTFFNVYRYISKLIRENQFNEAEIYLTDIKNTWEKAMKISI